MKIGTLDATLLLGYLVATVLFGLWMGRGNRTLSDYTVGGRNVPWWAVLFSIVATETSTVTFLSVPGIVFGDPGNLTWLQLPMGYIAGRLIVVGLLLPHYFRGQLFTAYEVLEQRFGGATKRVASVLFLVTRNLADGLRLFLTAIVLEQVAGIGLETAVVCIGIGTIVYTFVGGMRAVVWTDLVQFAVYMAGAGIALWVLCDRVPGGWEQIRAAGDAAGKFRLFDFGFALDRVQLFWTGLLGGAVLSTATHGVDQMMVQRYLCARSQREAGWALGLSGIVVTAQFALFMLLGIALWVFYQAQSTTFASSDRVFATFIVDEMPPGLLGILLGAVFSAAMSTLSSSLNSSATTAVHDLLLPNADDARKLRWARLLTIAFGAIQIGVGLAGQWTADAVVNNVLAIAGFTTGIVLGVFFLGVLTERVTQRAALAGLVVGATTMTAIHFGTDLAWPWYSLVGSLSTFAAGTLAARLVFSAS